MRNAITIKIEKKLLKHHYKDKEIPDNEIISETIIHKHNDYINKTINAAFFKAASNEEELFERIYKLIPNNEFRNLFEGMKISSTNTGISNFAEKNQCKIAKDYILKKNPEFIFFRKDRENTKKYTADNFRRLIVNKEKIAGKKRVFLVLFLLGETINRENFEETYEKIIKKGKSNSSEEAKPLENEFKKTTPNPEKEQSKRTVVRASLILLAITTIGIGIFISLNNSKNQFEVLFCSSEPTGEKFMNKIQAYCNDSLNKERNLSISFKLLIIDNPVKAISIAKKKKTNLILWNNLDSIHWMSLKETKSSKHFKIKDDYSLIFNYKNKNKGNLKKDVYDILNFVLGCKYFEEQNYSLALKHFENILDKNLYPEILLKACICCCNLNIHDKFLRFSEEVQSIGNFKNIDIINENLGIGFLLKADYSNAIKHFNEAYVKSTDARHLNNLAIAYILNHDYSDAIDILNQKISFNKFDIDAIQNLGLAYSLLGNKEYAIKKYKEVLNIDSTSVNAYTSLSNELNKQEKYHEAISYCKKAIGYDSRCSKAYFEIGFALCRLNAPEEAIIYFNEAINIDSTYIDALYNLAVLYSNNKEYNKAKDLWKKVIDIDSTKIKAYYPYGIALHNTGNNHLAIDILQKGINTLCKKDNALKIYYVLDNDTTYLHNSETKCKDLYNLIGNIYFNLKDYNNAVEYLMETYSLDSLDSEVNCLIGLSLVKEKNYKKAFYFLNNVIKTDANKLSNEKMIQVYLSLSHCSMFFKNYKSAREYLNSIELFFFQNDSNSFNIGNAWEIIEDYNKAKYYYKKALELNKYDTKIYNRIGYSYSMLSKYDSAVHYLLKAIDLAPNDGENHYLMGISQFGSKNYEEARIYLKKSIKFGFNIETSNTLIKETYSEQGYSLLKSKKYNDAITFLKQVVNLFPSDYKFRFYLGQALYNNKSFIEAIEQFNIVKRLMPNHEQIYYFLGLAFIGKKDYKNAVEYFKVHLKLNPNNFHANYFLSRSYFYLNNRSMAIKHLKTALKLEPDNIDAKKLLKWANNTCNCNILL